MWVWASIAVLLSIAPAYSASERRVTYYPNGKLRTESVFEKPGVQKSYRDWFDNGKLSKEILYKDGQEVSFRIFRRTGQIYLNRFMRDGRMYGLPGGKACNQIRKGSGG